jgi:Zn-dependent protease with chaperone function
MSFDVTTLLGFHVVVSLIGIATGLVVLVGLIANKRLEGLTLIFLATTLATSVTGFFFPVQQILPSHIVGAISIVVLALAIVAGYGKHLTGSWRWIYVVTAVTALYLNVFVLVVQLFLKVEALAVLAPNQNEPPFLIAQGAVLAAFVLAGIVSVLRFR